MRYYFFATLSVITFFAAISAIVIIQIKPHPNIVSQIIICLILITLASLFFKMKLYTLKEIIQKIKEELQADYL